MLEICESQPTRPTGRRVQTDWMQDGRTLSVRVYLTDLARFYKPEFDSDLYTGWSATDLNSTRSDRWFEDIGDVADWVAATTPPKMYVGAHAQRLAQAFAQVAKSNVVRDQTFGRLDNRKLPALARAVTTGKGLEDVRPYRRTENKPAKVPTIALIADGCNSQMWSRPEYIPSVSRLALSLQWAAEAAGLRVVTALTAEARTRTSKRLQYAYVLADPDRPVPPIKAYNAILHRDVWRVAIMSVLSSDLASHQKIIKARGSNGWYTFGPKVVDYMSGKSGDAVAWAKEMYGADYVITIGDVNDKYDATARLSAYTSLNTAVDEIIRAVGSKPR